MAQFIITYSAWTIGGALLGGLYYVLWGGVGPDRGVHGVWRDLGLHREVPDQGALALSPSVGGLQFDALLGATGRDHGRLTSVPTRLEAESLTARRSEAPP